MRTYCNVEMYGKDNSKSIRAARVGTVSVTEKYLAGGIFVTSEMRRLFTSSYRSRTQIILYSSVLLTRDLEGI